jgi:hypothetical protein
MGTKIEFYKRRDIGTVFSDTFRFIRLNRSILFSSLLKFAFPFNLAAILILVFAFSDLFGSIVDNSQSAKTILFFVLQLIFGLLMLMVGAVMFFTVVLEIMKLYHMEKETLTTQLVWKNTKKRFFKNAIHFFVWIIIYLMVAGTLSGIASILFIGLGAVAMMAGSFWIYGIMTGLSFIIQMIVTIYIFNATFPMLIISHLEDQDLGASLSKSFNLVHNKQNFWSSIAVTVIGFLINYLLVYNLFIPFSITLGVVMLNSVDVEFHPGSWLFTLIFQVVYPVIYLLSIFFFAINIITLTFKYLDMNENKNMTGLLYKLENLEKLEDYTPNYEDNF